MLKDKGFSLLEVLLVLVCAAAIISWSVHRYQQQQRRSVAIQAQADIKSLQRALDSYFHEQGCDSKGEFKLSALEVPCQTLQQSGDNVVCSRPPLITEYSARLIKTNESTTDTQPKPIYQLEIQATMSPSLTPDEIIWYQQELQAKSGNFRHILVWDSLPTNTYVQLGDKSWILNGAGSFFRAIENGRGATGVVLSEYSGSYCAN